MLLALAGAFVYAQQEVVMGDIQRIFYVHLPLAWVGFVAFGHACWAGVRYLQTGRRGWDIASASAAEIGVLFAIKKAEISRASGSLNLKFGIVAVTA